MPDRPSRATASYAVLCIGYASPGVAATVGYHHDQWHWRDAEGYQLTPAITLIRTPGHSLEDITTLAGTRHGVVAFTHLWNAADSVGDRHAVDLEALHAGRRRVLAVADTIVPGHVRSASGTGVHDVVVDLLDPPTPCW
jgi:hypothetical protein